ncbi:MAG: LysR family transcriptional regulator [Gammaproteobacteria bacterium]
MAALNYRHLRYFWSVARAGSIARASEQLHVTAHAISAQLAELEAALGTKLFRRAGRSLALTDEGRRALSYADEIFALGDEMVSALQDANHRQVVHFRVGISAGVARSVASRLLAPALAADPDLRTVCRDGALDTLLGALAVHDLDLVLADRPMPPNLNVRAFNHLLGRSGTGLFGPRRLARHAGNFAALLTREALLLPGIDVALRPRIEQWLHERELRPRIAGEIDDGGLLKSLAQSGAGLFVAPLALSDYVCRQYGMAILGELDGVVAEIYAISTARRLTHPAVLSIQASAQDAFTPRPMAAGRAAARRVAGAPR